MFNKVTIHKTVIFGENQKSELPKYYSLEDIYEKFYIVSVTGYGNFPFNYLCVDFSSADEALQEIVEIENQDFPEGESFLDSQKTYVQEIELSECRFIEVLEKGKTRYFHYKHFTLVSNFDVWANENGWSVNNSCNHFNGWIRFYHDEIISNLEYLEILKDVEFIKAEVILHETELSLEWNGDFLEIFENLSDDDKRLQYLELSEGETFEGWKVYPLGYLMHILND